MSKAVLSASAQTFDAARSKPLVLIAEDSFDGREMMRTLLSLKGYDVIVAEDGVQAMDLTLKQSPDLILIDVELPRLDGISVIRNIRRSSQMCGVPIIVVSGHDPARYEPEARGAGCTDYLMKPIDFERLEAILDRHLSIARARRTAA